MKQQSGYVSVAQAKQLIEECQCVQCCGGCRHFESFDLPVFKIVSPVYSRVVWDGYCKRYPPVLTDAWLSVRDEEYCPEPSGAWQQPVVDYDDLCGEWMENTNLTLDHLLIDQWEELEDDK